MKAAQESEPRSIGSISETFGGCKSLGGGLHELKIDFGPGYRVYFADVENVIVLLLSGGDKSTQAKDIDVAKKYLADYKKRTDENKTKR